VSVGATFLVTMSLSFLPKKYIRKFEHHQRTREEEKAISFDFMNDGHLGKDYRARPSKTHVHYAAMLSDLAYTETTTETLSSSISKRTHMLGTQNPSGIHFECGHHQTSKIDLPLLWMAVISKVVADCGKRMPLCEFVHAELYICFRGSDETQDWLTNFNGRSTASVLPLVGVHTGMFGVYNNSKTFIETLMRKYDTHGDTGVILDKVIFTGHSLGGGIAQVCNFQMQAASKPKDWPQGEDAWRLNSDHPPLTVWALTFAAPPPYTPTEVLDPIFRTARKEGCELMGYTDLYKAWKKGVDARHAQSEVETSDEEERATEKWEKKVLDANEEELEISAKVLDRVRTSSFGFIMEYDIVPRLPNQEFVTDAAKSAAEAKAKEAFDQIPGLRRLATVRDFLVPKVTEAAVDATAKEARETLQGLKHICTLIAFLTMPFPDKNWRLVFLQTVSQQYRFLSTPWPFKAARARATCVAIADHSVLPKRVMHEWQSSTCCHQQNDSQCQQIELDEYKLVDCMLCTQTFCEGCFGTVHQDRLLNWHVQEERDELVPVRKLQSSFDTLVDTDVNKVIKNMDWFRIWLETELESMSGAINIFWFCDMLKSAHPYILGLTKAPTGLTQADMLICAGIACVKSGVLLYQLLITGSIDASEFWKKLFATWAAAAASIGGAALGTWIGGVVGAFFGPVGCAVGLLVGGLVAAYGARAVGAAASEALLAALQGASPKQKEQMKLSMLCVAIYEFGITKAPSKVMQKDIASGFRRMARVHHPDKTGLGGKTHLTPAETEQWERATEKFIKVQHNHEMLDAFVDVRESDNTIWTEVKLKELDVMMPQIAKEFGKIDKESEEKKEKYVQKKMIKM